MNHLKRLYIFTGKGGVGKSTLSLAFAKSLEKDGHKSLFVYFKNNKLDEKSKSFQEAQRLADRFNVQYKGLELLEAAQGYIGQKLNSETVARWIVKTPFFKSVINMIPGFSYLIYLGQILELLEEDPKLHIILDSPSSGHAQTMLEATQNFSEIFQNGIVYQDTKRMLNLLNSPSFTQINIITLPTTLAINEALELKESLEKTGEFTQKIFCNNCLEGFDPNNLPESLQNKVKNESNAIKEADSATSQTVPYITDSDTIKGLVPFMKNLV